MKEPLKITTEDFVFEYFNVLNVIFKLTKRELEVLAKAVELSKDEILFSKDDRSLITALTGTSKQQVNNTITVLKKKAVIHYDENYYLNKAFLLDNMENVEITFVIKKLIKENGEDKGNEAITEKEDKLEADEDNIEEQTGLETSTENTGGFGEPNIEVVSLDEETTDVIKDGEAGDEGKDKADEKEPLESGGQVETKTDTETNDYLFD